MIHKVGLLPAGNRQQVPFAYKMYTLDDEFGWKQSKHFKQAFSVDVKVDFSVHVGYFRHAIALDERRAVYRLSSQSLVLDETRNPPRMIQDCFRTKTGIRERAEPDAR